MAVFSEDKLRASLRRAGASDAIIDTVLLGLEPQIYPGISTKQIYKIAFRLLRQKSKPVAARYHLKRGLMELGPSGFPFEKFIEEIFKQKGYSIIGEKILQGKCVTHEIDVIAEKNNVRLLVECKYHNQPGNVCDVKIPLYIQARFKDVEELWNNTAHEKKTVLKARVVTNTRFTSDAIQYGGCAGLELTGWNYPAKNSLRETIDSMQLYPVTCLTSLTHHEKQYLLDKNIVLCRDLMHQPDVLQHAGIKEKRMQTVLSECGQLCKI